MKKDLKALEEIKECYIPDEDFDDVTFYDIYSDKIDIIKSALERKDKLEKRNKDLENLLRMIKKHNYINILLIKQSKDYYEYIETYKELYWNPSEDCSDALNDHEFDLIGRLTCVKN